MSEMQSQGILQACLASQLTAASMERRNAAAMDLIRTQGPVLRCVLAGDFDALHAAVDSYDFDAALALLQKATAA